jgi:hypothetical protein
MRPTRRIRDDRLREERGRGGCGWKELFMMKDNAVGFMFVCGDHLSLAGSTDEQFTFSLLPFAPAHGDPTDDRWCPMHEYR